MYLIKLTSRGNLYKEDDGIFVVPEFQDLIQTKNLGANAMKWVALVYDYDSPYRHFSEKERVRAVSRDIFNSVEWKDKNKEIVLKAINKYKSLQYDPLDSQLQAFNEKIDEYTQLMKHTTLNADNAESMQKIMIGIDKILKTRQVVLDAIERRGERKKIAGDIQMSYLEKKQEYKNQI